jgi:hypothetical protein
MAILPVIDDLCKAFDRRGVAAVHSSSPPLIGFVPTHPLNSLLRDNAPFQEAVCSYAKKHRIKHVVLAAHWQAYDKEQLREGVAATLEAYKGSGIKLWFMLDVPNQPWNPPRVLANSVGKEIDPETLGLSIEVHRKIYKDLEPVFNQVIGSEGALLDPTPHFLNEHHGICRCAKDGRSLYWNGDHLSTWGAKQLLPLFEPLFKP